MMHIIVGLLGALLIVVALWDAFESVILPRRVTRPFRIARLVWAMTWDPWSTLARRMRPGPRRERFLSYYGPLSLLFLLASWAIILMFGFALLQWAAGSALSVPGGGHTFSTDLYFSGTTFVTLGLGDVAPRTPEARLFTVIEGATGFAFLALVISYVPVLYPAFSARERNITLLDARAGSPPIGAELLRRYARNKRIDYLAQFLQDWERWAADLLESHLSYPTLAFYRSQHDNESWLAALTCILDACALILAGIDGIPAVPARLTFAMARHAAGDLSQVLGATPRASAEDRLSPADLARVRAMLADVDIPLRDGAEVDQRLARLRALYEPYVSAMAERCMMTLPPWVPGADASDDWERTAWDSEHPEVRARLD